jgi:hypothetical protein
MGSGLPQFGFPRRFAIDLVSLGINGKFFDGILEHGPGVQVGPEETLGCYFTDIFFKNQ